MLNQTYNWIPLECNPEVFNSVSSITSIPPSQERQLQTSQNSMQLGYHYIVLKPHFKWAYQAGVKDTDAFCDIYGLDAELLSEIPRPVKAVIFVFPYSEAKDRRAAEDEFIVREGGPKVDESVFWMKQTIRNACGAMAMMHSFANTDVAFKTGSALEHFFNRCQGKSVAMRSQIFEEMNEFAEIHASVVDAGQSCLPTTDAHPDQAYCTFISAPGEGSTGCRVVELDGGRLGPVDHGECVDLLDDTARIVKEKFLAKNPSVFYSMLYLGHPT